MAGADQRGVRFVRMRGRIVPIRLNRDKASRRKGYGLVGAGAVVATGSAVAGAALVGNANKVASRAGNALTNIRKYKRLYSLDKKSFSAVSNSSANRLLKVGIIANKYVTRTLKLSRRITVGGAGLGAALMAAGATRAISKKDRPGVEATLAAGAGFLGFGLSNKVFKFVVKKKLKLG